jgi:hypothetical protein
MNATEVSEALVTWAQAVVPSLAGSGYDYPPMGKTKELPDVVAGVIAEAKDVSDERFPWSLLQQTGVRIFDCQLSIMVEPGDTDDDSKAAMDELRSMVRALMDSQDADATLNGLVFDTDPRMRADYEPGFVEYADGSRGREVRIVLTVAEPLEASR